MKKDTPKQKLLEVANENPRQIILASETNGNLRVDFQYASPGELLLLLHFLETEVKKEIGRKLISECLSREEKPNAGV
jgi:hypothetical protein